MTPLSSSPTNGGQLEPWLRGPFQLLEHASGHLKAGTDGDRLIALIGFDQAIEVCVDVFINLPVRLRGNYQVQHDEAEKALRNFHTKVEFVEKYASKRGIADLPSNHMVWFHQLRNELYHSGNGMVPEQHVLEGARAAAIRVFQALFEVDVSGRLGLESSDVVEAAQEIPAVSMDPRVDLLRLVQNAENALRTALQVNLVTVDRSSGLGPLLKLYFRTFPGDEQVVSREEAMNLVNVRNQTAHGLDVDEKTAAQVSPLPGN